MRPWTLTAGWFVFCWSCCVCVGCCALELLLDESWASATCAAGRPSASIRATRRNENIGFGSPPRITGAALRAHLHCFPPCRKKQCGRVDLQTGAERLSQSV